MKHSATLKQDLLRPEAYPESVRSEKVTLVETHISWVMLLDRDVFKVKRPVDLGFLDFRTEPQRKAACEAEVDLNRRLADGVYHGVVPVRRGKDGRARLDGDGPIIDWAVHMARLPDAIRADEILARGALGPDAIDAIARRLAAFHASSRCDAETSRFGAVAVIARNAEENFEQTRASIERYLSPKEAEEIRGWQPSFLRDRAAIFERRAAAGHVRDGHGDLRLEHVYLDHKGVTILDCIEFNERFRFADVCADVAFLSMDLAAHGRVDLAERILASYARESNDFDLYEVADFYESYRAFVRGKIAALVAADPDIDEATRRKQEGEARRYFLLSLSADRRSLLAPIVVAVAGVIASGKSTVADRVAQEIGAPTIDADRTRKAMLGVEATHHLTDTAWSGAYDPAFTETVYEEVLRRAGVVLASGRPVVIDASFRSGAMRHAARELARTHGVPFRLVECKATREVCLARLATREKEESVSDGRRAIFDDFVARFEPITELAAGEHVALDTTRPMDESVAALRGAVETWPKGLVG